MAIYGYPWFPCLIRGVGGRGPVYSVGITEISTGIHFGTLQCCSPAPSEKIVSLWPLVTAAFEISFSFFSPGGWEPS